ncbi:hypothetical protein AA313_de0208144 [Arthrobotrys entomopaga]|nr:hypothetical protein AA313_de0208144 [Arthrobotrys entomopaga]
MTHADHSDDDDDYYKTVARTRGGLTPDDEMRNLNVSEGGSDETRTIPSTKPVPMILQKDISIYRTT